MNSPLTNFEILKSVCDQLADVQAKINFWNESLTLSMNSLDQNMARFEKAIQVRDEKEIAAAAHKIVGTISFLGVAELSQKLAHIQESVENKTLPWPIPNLTEIKDQLALVKSEIIAAQKNLPG